MTEYRLRENYGRLSAAQVQQLGELITKLEEELGRPVTPGDLLVEAIDEKSPFHPFFEWDDRRAATQYRLDQARYILRAIEIVLPSYGGKRIRAFIPTAYGNVDAGFTSTEKAILARPDYIELQIRRAYEAAIRVDDELGMWRDLLISTAPEAAEFLGSARRLREVKEKVVV